MIDEFFFHTDKNYHYTYFYKEKENKSDKNLAPKLREYEKYLYIPTSYEKLTLNEIQSLKRKFVWRFYFWARSNSHKFNKIEDFQVINARGVDFFSFVLAALIIGKIVSKSISRLNIPVVEFLIEDVNKNTLILLKRVCIGACITGFSIYNLKTTLEIPYLYDLSLKYKEEFAPGEIASPNCEDKVAPLLKTLIKEEAHKLQTDCHLL